MPLKSPSINCYWNHVQKNMSTVKLICLVHISSQLGILILTRPALVQRGFSPDGKWVSMLSNHLSGKCDVINRGFSGYNTRMVKHFIEKAPGMPSFRIVIIEKLHRFVIPILGATGEIVNSFYFRWRLQQLLAGMFIVLPLKNHIV